ncbi:hypothetical protein HOLleu_16368 [Holothuria leucospilota]|uniref:Uncharacterized protein n=1 Tax=Holothuria leucospilota TaxID=206669 RepID=A0A9Q1C5Y0_HOLLE|nr:hypothetical protein HOLleu_16368 [Holothuria leucospilota]
MYLLNVGFLMLVVSFFSTSRALPASCQTDWKIHWNRQYPDFSKLKPFSNPGEILPGVTVNDTLRFVGMIWNTPSWEELMGHVCIHYGPLLYGLYPEEQIRSECDLLVTSLQKGQKADIFGRCVSYWDQIGVENMTRSLISYYDQCLRHHDMKQGSPSLDSTMCYLDPLATVYATNLLEKTSRVAFNLLEWLGPSPFSADWCGVCSALRILLSDSIDQILDKLKNLLMYPVADTLEYLHHADVCNDAQTVRTFFNLLAILQNEDEDVCGFLSDDHSREEYLDKGAKLIDAVLGVAVDDEVCTNALTAFISVYDQYGAIVYVITGWNLTSDLSRQEFCSELVAAFSDNSPYIPTPYIFPFEEISGLDPPHHSTTPYFSQGDDQYALSDNYPYIQKPYPFPFDEFSGLDSPQQNSNAYFSQVDDSFGRAHPLTRFIYADEGQLLPNFSFIDAVNVLGAFLRSNSLSAGLVVLCDVFESFLSEIKPSVQSLCMALRNDSAATVEKTCLSLFPQSSYFHPSLRIPTGLYVTVTGVDMTRKLFELSEISRDHVCSALDEYFHSNSNLQSMIRFGLDVYIAEILPIADKICKDYDSVMNYLQKGSFLEVKEFEKLVRVILDFILTHVGFSDRNQLCKTIDAGIDISSGRTKIELAETMQRQVLLFLTDSGRCKESAQSFQRIFVELNLESEFLEFLTNYTGYMSLSSACENLNGFFDPGLCKASTTTPTIPESTDTRTIPESKDTPTIPESTDTRTIPESKDTGTIPEFGGIVMALAVLITYLMYML